MRNLLCLTILLASPAAGQTPYGLANLVKDRAREGVGPERIAAPNNPWLGAQLAYKFGGTDDFSDNFLIGARFLYDPLGDNQDKGDLNGWHVPVMGNIADLTAAAASDASAAQQIEQQAQLLISSAQGLNVGIYPYRVLKKTDVLRVTLHSQAGWKLSTLKDGNDENVQFNEGRFSIGLEAALGKLSEEGRLPITLSISPTLTLFSPDRYQQVFGTRKGSIASVEITGVTPVGSGFGILFESILSGGDRSSFRTGLIFLTAPE